MGTELEDLKVESKSDGKKGEGKAGLIIGMGRWREIFRLTYSHN